MSRDKRFMAPVTRSQKIPEPEEFEVHLIEAMKPPTGIQTAMEYMNEKENDGKDESKIFTSAHLGGHIDKNSAIAQEMFANYKVNKEGFLIDRKTGLPLAASKVRQYNTVTPYLYRPDYLSKTLGSDDFLIQLLGALPQKGHKVDKATMDSVIEDCMSSFIYVFADLTISERELRLRVNNLVQKIVTCLVRKAQIHLIQEVVWAARGILAWGDESVGFYGYADHVMYAGNQILKACCCIEYKLVDAMKVAEGSRWIEISGALLAQIKGAMIGLEARAGIAWCQIGFKAMCRTNHTSPPEFAVWPDNDQFWRPSQDDERSQEDKDALRIVVEMVAGCLFV